jgi:gluconolactonase
MRDAAPAPASTSRLALVAETDAHEGPVYAADEDALYFTTLRRDRVAIKRLSLADGRVSVVRADANMANGMTLDREGRLVVCEQGTLETPARIARLDRFTGASETIVEGGLSSPNDVVVARDGAIWFTDPTYGWLQGFRPEPVHGDCVYRYDGKLAVVADSLDKPNGLAFSPDERVLYVGDSGAIHGPDDYDPDRARRILAFDVAKGRLENERVFADEIPGFPDGLKVDEEGRVYVSAATGVLVFAPDGELVDELHLPSAVNFALRRRAPPDHDRHGGLGRRPERSTSMREIRTRRVIDEAGVDAVLDAAEAFAREQGARVVIAVADPSGELVGLRRTPGAQVASSRVALDKARTAAIFVRPSREIEEQVGQGRLGALALHGASALTGGIPLKVGGETVGAIGTSGETPDEDEAISLAGAAAALSTAELPALTFEGARRAAEAAGAVAAERGVAPVIAAVDAGGELLYLHRPDAAQVASVGVATDKARTAAIYRRPSKDFEEQATNGRPSALHLARAVPLQGGMPIVHDGEVIGAIGVSGASSADEDQELATIGASALASGANGNGSAAYFAKEALARKFQEGGLFLAARGFKLDAGRRVRPGEVEYHEHAVDVMHVVEGTATVLTGGEMVGAREVAPGELRAAAVEGGTRHDLAEGDVLAVPEGVPHQFVEVSDPFLYFVVKVEA